MEGLQGAKTSLARIDECVSRLRESCANKVVEPDPGLVTQFSKVMDEDLNISGAWGAIFEWVREMNRQMAEGTLRPENAAAQLAAWEAVNKVLGVSAPAEVSVPAEIQALVEERQAARKTKDFARADAIRGELKAKGWVIEDTPKGARAKKI
jgi:cysteinyl-tRNA synthetase